MPRESCPKQGVRQVDLPWARPSSGFTLHIEAMVLAISDEMSMAGIAGHLNVNEDPIWCLQYYVNKARKDIDLSHVEQLAKSIRNHFSGIVESVHQRVTYGYAEGRNNMIRTTFRRAYGFKAKEYRDTMIYLVAGGIQLLTPN